MKTPEVLNIWTSQEGSRYKEILEERGFLDGNQENDADAIQRAAEAWRATYIQDIHPEIRTWNEGESATSDVANWRLGGWSGWKSYRQHGKMFTTFQDVATRIDTPTETTPKQHHEVIPAIARDISNVLNSGKIIILRCGDDVAVLEGTHRVSAIAYAMLHHLPVPETIRVIETHMTEDEREAFTRFCTDLPKAYGPHSTTKHPAS
jgi:hypothetical protein